MHTSTIIRFLKSNNRPSATELLLMLDGDTELLPLLNYLYESQSISERTKNVYLWACIHEPETAQEFLQNNLISPAKFHSLCYGCDEALEFIADELKSQGDEFWDATYRPVMLRLIEKYGYNNISFYDRAAKDIFKIFSEKAEEIFPTPFPSNFHKGVIPTMDTIVTEIQKLQQVKLCIATYMYGITLVQGELAPALDKVFKDKAFYTSAAKRVGERLKPAFILMNTDLLNTPGAEQYKITVGVHLTWEKFTKQIVRDRLTPDMYNTYVTAIALSMKEAIVQSNIGAVNFAIDSSIYYQQRHIESTNALTFYIKAGDIVLMRNDTDILSRLTALAPAPAPVPVAEPTSEEVPNE